MSDIDKTLFAEAERAGAMLRALLMKTRDGTESVELADFVVRWDRIIGAMLADLEQVHVRWLREKETAVAPGDQSAIVDAVGSLEFFASEGTTPHAYLNGESVGALLSRGVYGQSFNAAMTAPGKFRLTLVRIDD